MPLTIWLQARVEYDKEFMSLDEWNELYKGNRAALIDLLNQDMLDLLELAGGLDQLVVDADWKE